MPVPIGLLYLNTRRSLLEKYDLLVVGSSHGGLFDPKEFPYRTGDGKYNDPHNAKAGSQYTFFGRNMKPVDQEDEIEITAPKEVANECPLKSFKFLATKEMPTNSDGIKTGHYNEEHPNLSDQELYRYAKLVTSAVIAKVWIIG
nr:unnamed protein product [Digitaria exilis]